MVPPITNGENYTVQIVVKEGVEDYYNKYLNVHPCMIVQISNKEKAEEEVNYKDGSVFKDKEITRKILSPTTDGFVAGKTYNIILRINSSDLGLSE